MKKVTDLQIVVNNIKGQTVSFEDNVQGFDEADLKALHVEYSRSYPNCLVTFLYANGTAFICGQPWNEMTAEQKREAEAEAELAQAACGLDEEAEVEYLLQRDFEQNPFNHI